MSPYFPKRGDEKPYKCEGCGKWFVIPVVSVSCSVIHPEGTCCHVGETELDWTGREKASTVSCK